MWYTVGQGLDPITHLAAAAQGRDLAICGVVRCALRIGATVLTYDKHFQAIPGLATDCPNVLDSHPARVVADSRA